ncbi:MAG: ribosomal RNA small subunit methyltransferase A [Verrucomicrobiales bacterium]|nr:ribosomal RNA small subunit methyltransferase A [Verrucomicrobiales bacterium]
MNRRDQGQGGYSRGRSERRRVISGVSVTPRKSLGQNFLQDEEVARWIADQIKPDGVPFVVEIGPGVGALTKHLVGRPKHLLLVEKDTQLAAEQRAAWFDKPSVEVVEADATRIDMRPWYARGEVRAISNLPYSVGGEILRHLLTPPTPITEAVFMLQKEVCLRLSAPCGANEYGGLSVLVQQDWDVELLRIVPPEVFVPKPKVDSGVIRLRPRSPSALPVYDRLKFDRLVRLGFGQRRKQLKNLLPEAPGGWEAVAAALDKPTTMRAEELSLPQWVQLARWYEGRTTEDAGQKATEMFDVVDENNQVVEQLPRGEVHARGLRHRAVHIFVINPRGDIYLQRRSHLKDVAPLKWDSSAAGHLDVGESYAAAALRELHEELGIRVDETKLAVEVPADEGTDNEFVELRIAHHPGPVKVQPEEIHSGTWFTPELIDGWVAARPEDFAKGFVTCWRAFRRSLAP